MNPQANSGYILPLLLHYEAPFFSMKRVNDWTKLERKEERKQKELKE
jgi:hypothetical protein